MKTSHFEAVLYDGEVYCIKCLPKGITRKDVESVDSRHDWAQVPTCCECGMEHYAEGEEPVEEDVAAEEEEDEEDDILAGIGEPESDKIAVIEE